MNKAIFLDRDGTINFDYGYLYKIDDLKLLPGAAEALLAFRQRGYMLIVITNQSGVGRGYFTMNDVNAFNKALDDELERYGVEIDDYFICPHAPEDKCTCRKPLPYLINEAVKRYDIDKKSSYMLGDKNSDVECGESAGVKSFLVTPEHSLIYWAHELLK